MIIPLLVKSPPDTLEEILLCCEPSGGFARPQLGKTTLVFQVHWKDVSLCSQRGSWMKAKFDSDFLSAFSQRVFFLAFRQKRTSHRGHSLDLCSKGFSKGWQAGHASWHVIVNVEYKWSGSKFYPILLGCPKYKPEAFWDQIQLARKNKNIFMTKALAGKNKYVSMENYALSRL